MVALHCDKGMSETKIISSIPLQQLLNVCTNAVPVYDYNQSHLTPISSAALAGTACDLFTLRQEQLDRDVHTECFRSDQNRNVNYDHEYIIFDKNSRRTDAATIRCTPWNCLETGEILLLQLRSALLLCTCDVERLANIINRSANCEVFAAV